MSVKISVNPPTSHYPFPMAEVTEKRPDGTAVVVVPPNDAADLEVGEVVDVRPAGNDESLPPPFGIWAGKFDKPFTIEEIKAARQEALSGKDN